MKPKNHFKELYLEYSRIKNPSLPESVRSMPSYFSKANSTNGLTKMVIAFIRLQGWKAERITSSGRYIDNTKIVADVIGNQRKIGSGKYITGTSQKGTADISAVIEGKNISIEIKCLKTRDRQSEAQKEYEYITTLTGGVYFIAKTFEGFYSWYMDNFKENVNKIEVLKEYAKNKHVII